MWHEFRFRPRVASENGGMETEENGKPIDRAFARTSANRLPKICVAKNRTITLKSDYYRRFRWMW
jgi:hypothetical protein